MRQMTPGVVSPQPITNREPGPPPRDLCAVGWKSRMIDTGDTVCPRCGESQELAKVKGCITCLKCGFKFDCNGW